MNVLHSQRTTENSDSAPFIEFILQNILTACDNERTQNTPQVQQLLNILVGEMSREELQTTLALKDRKSFRIVFVSSSH